MLSELFGQGPLSVRSLTEDERIDDLLETVQDAIRGVSEVRHNTHPHTQPHTATAAHTAAHTLEYTQIRHAVPTSGLCSVGYCVRMRKAGMTCVCVCVCV